MMSQGIDLDLLVLDHSTTQRCLETLRHRLPWLAAHPDFTLSSKFLKDVGTQACIRKGSRLELTVEGSFGDRASLLVEKDNWSWR